MIFFLFCHDDLIWTFRTIKLRIKTKKKRLLYSKCKLMLPWIIESDFDFLFLFPKSKEITLNINEDEYPKDYPQEILRSIKI